MEVEIKEDYLTVNNKASIVSIDYEENFDYNRFININFLLDDYSSKMKFSFTDFPNYNELAKRFLSINKKYIKRPIEISIKFPLITEAELQSEAERKLAIAKLKDEIKEKESRLKCLESIDNIMYFS